MSLSDDHLRYVNDETTAIRTSMRETVLLSLENGQYIPCFTGHTHETLNLSVSSIRDTSHWVNGWLHSCLGLEAT